MPPTTSLERQVQELARPFGDVLHRRLHQADFQAGQQNVNTLSPAASHRVARRWMTSVVNQKALRLRVRGYFHATAAGGAPEVFDLTTAGFTSGIAQPPNGESVVALVNGAVVVPAAINYAAGTVSLNTAANDDVVIYALGLDGQLEIHVGFPTGGLGGQTAPVFNKTMAELNTIEQAGGLTAPRLRRATDLVLGPDFTLAVYVDTPYTVKWDAAAEHEISIPVYSRQVDPTNRTALADAVRRLMGL